LIWQNVVRYAKVKK
jgi:DnaJ-class molecular chaperone